MAKLYFYYASMNAGKSTNLLQANFNYGERGMATMLWTAALDNRTERAIESRIGLGADALHELLLAAVSEHDLVPSARQYDAHRQDQHEQRRESGV